MNWVKRTVVLSLFLAKLAFAGDVEKLALLEHNSELRTSQAAEFFRQNGILDLLESDQQGIRQSALVFLSRMKPDDRNQLRRIATSKIIYIMSEDIKMPEKSSSTPILTNLIEQSIQSDRGLRIATALPLMPMRRKYTKGNESTSELELNLPSKFPDEKLMAILGSRMDSLFKNGQAPVLAQELGMSWKTMVNPMASFARLDAKMLTGIVEFAFKSDHQLGVLSLLKTLEYLSPEDRSVLYQFHPQIRALVTSLAENAFDPKNWLKAEFVFGHYSDIASELMDAKIESHLVSILRMDGKTLLSKFGDSAGADKLKDLSYAFNQIKKAALETIQKSVRKGRSINTETYKALSDVITSNEDDFTLKGYPEGAGVSTFWKIASETLNWAKVVKYNVQCLKFY